MKNQNTLYSGKHEMQKSHLFDFLHQFNKTSKSVTYGCSSILLKPRCFRVKNTIILTEKKHFTIFTSPIIHLVYYPFPKFCIHCTCNNDCFQLGIINWRQWLCKMLDGRFSCIQIVLCGQCHYCKSDQLLEVWINYPSLTTKYHIKP